MDYMTAKEAAEKWAITPRRVQVLCTQGKIPGAVRFGVTWAIPKNMVEPKDGRYKSKNEAKLLFKDGINYGSSNYYKWWNNWGIIRKNPFEHYSLK